MGAEALTLEEFSSLLKHDEKTVAVGVSGGSDSMVLCKFLSLWAAGNGGKVIALTVDHGLREAAAREAEQVGAWVSDWSDVEHHILCWEHDGQESRVQEEARNARYDLMMAFCRERGIKSLFVAHHMDDQAETVLFRLAKGSGVDGLAGMSCVQELGGDLKIVRPFLNVPKERLVKSCEALKVSFIEDPSNENDRFARVRLRQARAVLEEEGLSAKRLAVTAKRIERAKDALSFYVDQVTSESVLEKDSGRIVFDFGVLFSHPDEIALRCLMNAQKELVEDFGYGPRFEKFETLFADLKSEGSFRKRTLGRVIFERDDEKGEISLTRE